MSCQGFGQYTSRYQLVSGLVGRWTDGQVNGLVEG